MHPLRWHEEPGIGRRKAVEPGYSPGPVESTVYSSMRDALYTLVRTGSPMDVLIGYYHLMRRRDTIGNGIAKNEEHHRDGIWTAILENPATTPAVEYQVRKVRSLLAPRIANVKLTCVVED